MKNEDKISKLPTISITPVTPILIANPNIGYTTIAFSTILIGSKDPNLYLDSGISYYMTPFWDRFITFESITVNPASNITGYKIIPYNIKIT